MHFSVTASYAGFPKGNATETNVTYRSYLHQSYFYVVVPESGCSASFLKSLYRCARSYLQSSGYARTALLEMDSAEPVVRTVRMDPRFVRIG